MAEQNQASTEPTHSKGAAPMPVTPSDETERPEGLAFDVAKGADLSGVPTGDQAPANPDAARTEDTVRRSRRRCRAGRSRRPTKGQESPRPGARRTLTGTPSTSPSTASAQAGRTHQDQLQRLFS